MKNNSKPIVLVVIGILIGGYGLLGSGQTAALPMAVKYMGYFRQFMPLRIPSSELPPQRKEAAEQFLSGMMGMFDKLPPSFFRMCLVLGLTGVAVNVLYIVAFASLLTSKKWRFTLFYAAITLSITYALMRWLLCIPMEETQRNMLSPHLPYVRIALDLAFLFTVERWEGRLSASATTVANETEPAN